jgi:hypothetical protein
VSHASKGEGKVISKGVVVYKDAVPKTGTKLTEGRITKRFRSLTQRKRPSVG